MKVKNKEIETSLKTRIEKFYQHAYSISTLLDVKRFARVVQFINQSKATSVLDVGCGNGALLENINSQIRVGLDIFHYKHPRSFHFVLGDAQHLPFRDCSFTLVSACEVLEHTENMERTLSEIKRVTKNDGQEIITVPNDFLIHLAGRLFNFLPKTRKAVRKEDLEYHRHSAHHQKGNLAKRVQRQLGRPMREEGMFLPIFLPLPYSFSLFFLMVFSNDVKRTT